MPTREIATQQTLPIAVAAVLLAGLVLAADVMMPLGSAEWALYLVPILLSLFQPQAWLPYALAALTTVFTTLGWHLSPEGIDGSVAVWNRLIGATGDWLLAWFISRVLATRGTLQRLLWVQQGKTAVARALTGELGPAAVGDAAARALSEASGAQIAALYRLQDEQLVLGGSHAADRGRLRESFALGDGLVGEVARSGRPVWLHEVPAGDLDLSGAFGNRAPRHLLVAPVRADGRPSGAIELGFLSLAVPAEQIGELADEVAETIGLVLRGSLHHERLVELVGQTQRQSRTLQDQQEELRVSNEELEERARALQASQARLEAQQAELEQTNVQLEERTQALQRQRAELQEAKARVEETANELRSASQYKSEFLANMSHELRTPLNSALILSKLLADNREETLTPGQVRHARAIHDANNDLLVLINDVLDLSRIEAGRVDLVLERVAVQALAGSLRSMFDPLVTQKGLDLVVEVDAAAPATLVTDGQRLSQILRNLLANAVKFTSAGEVALRVRGGGGQLQFEVSDTGIGIAKDQQALIFEAFRQADGSTRRRFGGTGLGLSISLELARRLGGGIEVDSEPGRGSRFVLRLPEDGSSVIDAADLAPPGEADVQRSLTPTPPGPAPRRAAPDATGGGPAGNTAQPARGTPAPAAAPSTAGEARDHAAPASFVADDRDATEHRSRMILVIEDDVRFAQVLVELAHEMDFDCVVATTAAEGLRLAHESRPSAVLLDVGLPDASGLSVLEQLKRDPQTRHLPVHMMSGHDRARTARELGAIGYLMKPVSRDDLARAIAGIEQRLQQRLSRVLVVEDDPELCQTLGLLLAGDQVEVVTVGRISQALEQLGARAFDCIVMDLMLPDGSGYDMLERMADSGEFSFPPVIVYTGRALTRAEEERLRRYSRSIIIKGTRSPERLLDEVTLFLHSVEAALPADRQRMLRAARRRDAVLDGRRLLLAEDDVRNIFALTSVFEPLGAKLEIARNGREALECLGRTEIDLVLMDIMMPEMDGLEAMRRIRAEPRWAQLPIIALTAKAMPDDRERCLEAGANDYIAKPIDVDRLISLTRVWCPK